MLTLALLLLLLLLLSENIIIIISSEINFKKMIAMRFEIIILH